MAIFGPNDRRAMKKIGKQIRDDIRLFRLRAARVDAVVRTPNILKMPASRYAYGRPHQGSRPGRIRIRRTESLARKNGFRDALIFPPEGGMSIFPAGDVMIAGRVQQIEIGKSHDDQANDQRDGNHDGQGRKQAATLRLGATRCIRPRSKLPSCWKAMVPLLDLRFQLTDISVRARDTPRHYPGFPIRNPGRPITYTENVRRQCSRQVCECSSFSHGNR